MCCKIIIINLVGCLKLLPQIRPEAQKIISYIKNKGMEIYIISGDYKLSTSKLGAKFRIEHYFVDAAALSNVLRNSNSGDY